MINFSSCAANQLTSKTKTSFSYADDDTLQSRGTVVHKGKNIGFSKWCDMPNADFLRRSRQVAAGTYVEPEFEPGGKWSFSDYVSPKKITSASSAHVTKLDKASGKGEKVTAAQAKPKVSVTEAASSPQVAQHAKRLEAALEKGGDDWHAAIQALKADKAMSATHLKALAKKFTGASVASGAAALKKIEARNAFLETSRAKSASRAGRSAA